MAPMDAERPFRWSLARREQLGGIAPPRPPAAPYAGFFDDLRAAAARVLAFAPGADLAFIGRSLENVFDYLSGGFDGIETAPETRLIPFSLRSAGTGGVAAIDPALCDGLFAMLEADGLAPAEIAARRRPLALVDYVAAGGTMENLCGLLKRHAERRGVDWAAVARRLVLIGLRTRTKNSPNTWRWQQHQDWLRLIPDTPIRNVSAPMRFLYYVANDQPKVTVSHHPGRWLAEPARPALTEERRGALAFAIGLYDRGRAERAALARELARPRYMREAATRALIAALKRAG